MHNIIAFIALSMRNPLFVDLVFGQLVSLPKSSVVLQVEVIFVIRGQGKQLKEG